MLLRSLNLILLTYAEHVLYQDGTSQSLIDMQQRVARNTPRMCRNHEVSICSGSSTLASALLIITNLAHEKLARVTISIQVGIVAGAGAQLHKDCLLPPGMVFIRHRSSTIHHGSHSPERHTHDRVQKAKLHTACAAGYGPMCRNALHAKSAPQYPSQCRNKDTSPLPGPRRTGRNRRH
jgi:hypothetical protein